jgi:hypothetical protein
MQKQKNLKTDKNTSWFLEAQLFQGLENKGAHLFQCPGNIITSGNTTVSKNRKTSLFLEAHRAQCPENIRISGGTDSIKPADSETGKYHHIFYNSYLGDRNIIISRSLAGSETGKHS